MDIGFYQCEAMSRQAGGKYQHGGFVSVSRLSNHGVKGDFKLAAAHAFRAFA
jgi:hypothetical protein